MVKPKVRSIANQNGNRLSFAMTLFPASRYHGLILSSIMSHNPGLSLGNLKG